MLLEAGAIVAVAVAVLMAVTTLALRRSEANRRSRAAALGGRGAGADVGTRVGRNLGGGMLASLPTWGGVLVTVVLLLRGKVALALVAAVATIVHAGVLRWRAAHR